MEISNKRQALVEFQRLKSSHHWDSAALVTYLLESNGAEFVELVKTKLLPQAEQVWEKERLEQAAIASGIYDLEELEEDDPLPAAYLGASPDEYDYT